MVFDTTKPRARSLVIACLVLCFAPAIAAEPESTERGFLGFRYVYEALPDGGGGFRIQALLPDGPCARAGVQRGDLVVRVNGQAYRNDAWNPQTDDPFAWVRPGGVLDLEIRRGETDETVRVRVTAERVPDIERLRRKPQGTAPMLDRADALLRQLAAQRAVLEIDASTQAVRRIGDPLDAIDRKALERFLFTATPLGKQLTDGSEPGSSVRVRLSLDPTTDHVRFDSVAAAAEGSQVESPDR